MTCLARARTRATPTPTPKRSNTPKVNKYPQLSFFIPQPQLIFAANKKRMNSFGNSKDGSNFRPGRSLALPVMYSLSYANHFAAGRNDLDTKVESTTFGSIK